MLTGMEILKRVKEGTIQISDFSEARLNPNSYNLRLGNTFMIYSLDQYKTYQTMEDFTQYDSTSWYLDSKQPNNVIQFRADEKGIILFPNKLYLASTMEKTWAKDLIPCISGRSSYARLGIEIHKTAGFGDVGYASTWTLEIEVTHPVRVYPEQEICQIYFEEPTGDTTMTYTGKYQDFSGVAASKSYLDFENQ